MTETTQANVVVEAFEDRVRWMKEMDDPTEPLWPDGPSAIEYVAGLVRPTGSFVKGLKRLKQMRQLFEQLKWAAVTDALSPNVVKEGHVYFMAHCPSDVQAFVGVVPFCELNDDDLAEVRIVPMPHGLEFQVPGEPREADEIFAIIDEHGLVTWHPGEPIQPLQLETAVPGISAVNDQDLQSIRVYKGDHGLEFYARSGLDPTYVRGLNGLFDEHEMLFAKLIRRPKD